MSQKRIGLPLQKTVGSEEIAPKNSALSVAEIEHLTIEDVEETQAATDADDPDHLHLVQSYTVQVLVHQDHLLLVQDQRPVRAYSSSSSCCAKRKRSDAISCISS